MTSIVGRPTGPFSSADLALMVPGRSRRGLKGSTLVRLLRIAPGPVWRWNGRDDGPAVPGRARIARPAGRGAGRSGPRAGTGTGAARPVPGRPGGGGADPARTAGGRAGQVQPGRG